MKKKLYKTCVNYTFPLTFLSSW